MVKHILLSSLCYSSSATQCVHQQQNIRHVQIWTCLDCWSKYLLQNKCFAHYFPLTNLPPVGKWGREFSYEREYTNWAPFVGLIIWPIFDTFVFWWANESGGVTHLPHPICLYMFGTIEANLFISLIYPSIRLSTLWSNNLVFIIGYNYLIHMCKCVSVWLWIHIWMFFLCTVCFKK